MKTKNSSAHGTPNPFITKHADAVIGDLHGFDRLRLQGTLPPLYSREIMEQHLWAVQWLHKDFATEARKLTARMREGIEATARAQERPVIYLRSSQESKEERARAILAESPVKEGVICVFSCQETGRTYEAHPNRATRKLELQLRPKRCIHLYVYLLDAVLGFMHLRFQTWFPFLIQLCVNGREWLAQQMTRDGIDFVRERNCFTQIGDVAAAQRLLDSQPHMAWGARCDRWVARYNPVAAEVRAPLGLEYCWTVSESEYAHDIMFKDRAALAALYPRLVHHGITSFGCAKVLRFAGRTGRCTGEVKSTCKKREEGVCLKHWVESNSIKMYDKGPVLRVETTINDASDFRVLRPPADDPHGEPESRPLRRSVADLPRRAEVSHGATERYYEALSVVDDATPLGQATARLHRRVKFRGQWVRALHPFAAPDLRLLTIVNDLKFTVTGLTNAEVREALYGQRKTRQQTRRDASRVTRLLRLLRAHGLLRKVRKAHRYHVTPKGRRLITALLTASHASTEELTERAA
jgi:hypothetical protein